MRKISILSLSAVLLCSLLCFSACAKQTFSTECASAVISETKGSPLGSNTILREGKELSDYIDDQFHAYALRWKAHPNVVRIDDSELGDLHFVVTLYRDQEVTNQASPSVDTVRISIYDNAVCVNDRTYDANQDLIEATHVLLQQAVKLTPL